MGKTSYKIIIALIILSLFLIAIIILFQLSFPHAQDEKSSNREASNGIVTNIWIDETSRLDALKNNKMKYLFVDVGDTSHTGKFITQEEEIISFIKFIENYEKTNNYNFVLLPYSEIIVGNYNLNTPEFKENIIKNYKNLFNLGFDGVFIDIEKIPFEQRDKYISILKEIEENLPKNAILTVYAGSLSENPNEWEWDESLYYEVSKIVDIITIPGYDTKLETEEGYQFYLSQQIKKINSLSWKAKFLLGIPTHKEYPETIENALKTYQKLKDVNTNFIGVSIFSEWTINDIEWKIYENYFHSN